jgi:hypothetical protein
MNITRMLNYHEKKKYTIYNSKGKMVVMSSPMPSGFSTTNSIRG